MVFNVEMDVTVNTVENITRLSKAVGKIIEDELNLKLKKAAIHIKNNFGPVFINALKAQPEYNSLIDGELKEEFGLLDGSSKINTIMKVWVESLRVKMRKFRFVNTDFTGGIRVEAIRSDFTDVMALDEGYQITEKEEALHWLQWLLLAGDQVIIKDYVIVEGGLFHGRAGSKIMRARGGGTWSVPPQFRGNIDDNWVTRAVEAADDKFNMLFEEAF